MGVGKREAETLITKHRRWVYRLAHEHGPISAMYDIDDIAQEIMIAACRALSTRYDPERAQVTTFIGGVAWNVCCKLRGKVARSITIEENYEPMPRATNTGYFRDLFHDLCEKAKAISPWHSTVLKILYTVDGSVSLAAKKLRMSTSEVRRALAAIRRLPGLEAIEAVI